MRRRFEPRLDILPDAQIWPLLAPASGLAFVLYGGTAVALHLGHRRSIDFDFFRSQPLEKTQIERAFSFVRDAQTLQESLNTLVVAATMPSGPVLCAVAHRQVPYSQMRMQPVRSGARSGFRPRK